MIKVIIFDLDGLLIDSEPLQYRAVSQAFSEKGFPLTEADWYEWLHKKIGYKGWIELNNLPLVPEEIRARKKEIYDNLIETEMELKLGARELIDLVHGKYRLAIASGSRIESIELCLDKFNLLSKFEHLITDQKNGLPKPHPDVFLHAAKVMNVEPEECLVFEDSLAGLQAAKAAGIKCIVCPDTFIPVDRALYANAAKIVENLGEVTLEDIDILGK